MSKQKRIIKLTAAAVTALLILIFLVSGIVQCCKVNKKYPAPVVKAACMSQELMINDNNLKVTATGFELKKIDELCPDHSIKFDYSADSRIALVRLNVKNVSDGHEYFSLTSPVLTANGWKNGLFLDMFMMLNDEYDTDLEPDESIDIIAPYAMFDYQFEKSNWEKIDSQEFSIVFDVYPERVYIDLSK